MNPHVEISAFLVGILFGKLEVEWHAIHFPPQRGLNTSHRLRDQHKLCSQINLGSDSSPTVYLWCIFKDFEVWLHTGTVRDV